MSNKLDKRTNCDYCNKPFEAKYRSKRFCDDKCRIYWNREQKIESLAKGDILKYSETESLNKTEIKVFDEKAKSAAISEFTKIPPQIPERLEGESALDYRIRCEELKKVTN